MIEVKIGTIDIGQVVIIVILLAQLFYIRKGK
jgi:hypothetical protein